MTSPAITPLIRTTILILVLLPVTLQRVIAYPFGINAHWDAIGLTLNLRCTAVPLVVVLRETVHHGQVVDADMTLGTRIRLVPYYF